MSQKKLLLIAGVVVLALFGYLMISRQNQLPEAEILPAQQDSLMMREEPEAEELLESEQEIDQQEINSVESAVLGAEEEKTVEETTQAAAKKSYILFYGETCPYCHDVLDWMGEVGLDSLLEVEQREVYNNPQYNEQMKLAATNCGVTRSGVPFLYDAAEKECVVGSTPIIDYLSAEAGI